MSSYEISCKHCRKHFKTVSSKNRHLRNVHADSSENGNYSSRIYCPCCPSSETNNSFKTFEIFMDHLDSEHQIKCEIHNFEFEGAEAFYKWKDYEEKKTKAFFMKNAQTGSIQSKILYFECHRSNFTRFKSTCTQRTPKVSGTIKINGICPSRIRAEFFYNSTKISVRYCETHVGHKPELKCQPLTLQEENIIVTKIKAGESCNDIIQQVRKLDDGSSARMNLLTKKDVYYIHKKYKLSGKRHTIVDLKVAEWNKTHNNVFIFKKPGENGYELDNEDFVLAFCSEEMQYMLQTYGSQIICMDGTHGTKPYSYELTSILVLDDQGIAFPVLFLLSNRRDKVIYQIVLGELKKITGPIIPTYFMTDDTSVYWDSWNSIMGPVPHRLLCPWHVKTNWAVQGKSKIINKRNEKQIQKLMNDMMKVTEEMEFIRIKDMLIKYLIATKETTFLNYILNNYLQSNERIKIWAQCYRQHTGINTNKHLESLYKDLKYHYLSSSSIQRLETCLDALDKLLVNKPWKRDSSILRPTTTHSNLEVKTAEMCFDIVPREPTIDERGVESTATEKMVSDDGNLQIDISDLVCNKVEDELDFKIKTTAEKDDIHLLKKECEDIYHQLIAKCSSSSDYEAIKATLIDLNRKITKCNFPPTAQKPKL